MKLPYSHQECWLILSRWPTWSLGPQVLVLRLVVTFLWPLPSPYFCGLLSPVGCSLLLLRDLALPCFLPASQEILHTIPKQTKESSDWHPLTPTKRMHTSCQHCSRSAFLTICCGVPVGYFSSGQLNGTIFIYVILSFDLCTSSKYFYQQHVKRMIIKIIKLFHAFSLLDYMLCIL